MSGILVWAALAAIALWALDRLAIWAESRGWIYYRHRRASPGTAAAAFMEVQSLLDPGARHAVELRRDARSEADESGEPPDDPDRPPG